MDFAHGFLPRIDKGNWTGWIARSARPVAFISETASISAGRLSITHTPGLVRRCPRHSQPMTFD